MPCDKMEGLDHHPKVEYNKGDLMGNLGWGYRRKELGWDNSNSSLDWCKIRDKVKGKDRWVCLDKDS